MKIAVNTRFLLPRYLEGIGGFTHEVLQRLVARRPDDTFFFLFDRPFDPHFVYGPNVRPSVWRPPARHPLLWYAWFEASVPRALARLQPDVWLSPDGYCSLRAHTPTVMVTHDLAHLHYPGQVPWLVQQYYQYFVPRYLQRAEQVVTVSAYTRQDILSHYPALDPHKITVACNGVKPAFRPLPLADQTDVRARYAQGRPYFFYLGAVHPRKNLPRLIAAYDLWRRQHCPQAEAPLLLIGGRMAWQTTAIEAARRQAQFRDDIHFLGYLPAAELPRVVGAALALVYVSLFEGFGVPLLEAMHCEVPVITSLASSLPEVAGEAALLVDPTSVPAIAQALHRLYTQPQLRAELVEKGRQQRLRFSWEQATDVVETALLAAASH